MWGVAAGLPAAGQYVLDLLIPVLIAAGACRLVAVMCKPTAQ
jgi:hypothetical protein